MSVARELGPGLVFSLTDRLGGIGLMPFVYQGISQPQADVVTRSAGVSDDWTLNEIRPLLDAGDMIDQVATAVSGIVD